MPAASTTVTRKTDDVPTGRAGRTRGCAAPCPGSACARWTSPALPQRAQHAPAAPAHPWLIAGPPLAAHRATEVFPTGTTTPAVTGSSLAVLTSSGSTPPRRPGRAAGGSGPRARRGPARRTTGCAAAASSALISTTASARRRRAPRRPGRRRRRPARPRARPRLASPIRSASAAPSRRPVTQISSARAYPTSSTRRLVPPRSGTSPSVTSAIDSCASSASTRRSQASASWKPAPIACPWTAAIGDQIRAGAAR